MCQMELQVGVQCALQEMSLKDFEAAVSVIAVVQGQKFIKDPHLISRGGYMRNL